MTKAVELREVETFLTLAEELHFGRTAKRLYLSRSRVSQTVRALEKRVGGRLFERTSRRVRLTPIGEKLADRLRPAHTELLQAFEVAHDLAAGASGELRVHAVGLHALGPSFDRVRDIFTARHPGCRLLVHKASAEPALLALRRGAADLLATWMPPASPHLTIGPVLATEDRVLLVSVGHPLLARGEATVEDLARHPVGDFDDAGPSELWCPAYTPTGRPIARRPIGASGDLLSAVADGAIVHPTVTSYPDYHRHPKVTHLPIRGLPPMRSVLVWVTARETAAIRALADLAGDLGRPSGQE